MLEMFFNYKDVKFIPEGKTVNKELYLEILNDYEMESNKNNLKKWTTKSWCHHSGTLSLFPQPRTNEFLPIPTTVNKIESTPFYGLRWNDRKCVEAIEGHLKK